jgi:hypothetical protein
LRANNHDLEFLFLIISIKDVLFSFYFMKNPGYFETIYLNIIKYIYTHAHTHYSTTDEGSIIDDSVPIIHNST